VGGAQWPDDRLDVIQLREILPQVVVAAFENRVLLPGTNPTTRGFSIAIEQRIRHVHPFDDAAERHERFLVVDLPIVFQVDHHLRLLACDERIP
jgi:hypothetical protein